ncbi:hypothetical protein EFBL_2218 [Effusibacillus lacus]|uniref:Uncharacterized protein n=2 Tax=Effusibacillus lacus TaxID=1348429 RepID=A0A292YNV7_9BACL|nr:hypothetical protein EFBL_2218 [Effusibacillus lacus]
MSGSESEREVAKAFVQLGFYLKALNMPFTVKDIYRRAYKERLGNAYSDDWIDCLTDDPEVQECLEEPFTVYSVAKTLKEYGHAPINYALYRMIRRLDIYYSHAYVISIAQE